MVYRFRQRATAGTRLRLDMDVRMFTVGPVAENSYIFRRDGSDRALIVDPGDEPDKLLDAIEALGVELDGILLTHTHFDHIGAVAPVARATGAEVWVPEIERSCWPTSTRSCPGPGLGPFESYEAEHTLDRRGGLELAGFEIDVLFTPRPQPRPRDLLDRRRAGDLLGRRPLPGLGRATDLPGGDWGTLLARSARSWTRSPPRRRSIPGTWASRASARSGRSNPFLAELAR